MLAKGFKGGRDHGGKQPVRAGPRTARLPSRVAERTARPAHKGHLVFVWSPG